jgi:hypothetical protein
MKEIRVRISPTGGRFKHIYNDALRPMDEALGNFEVNRATDVFFDNASNMWMIRDLSTGETLEESFIKREDALAFEHNYLQHGMGSGVRA